MDELPVLFAVAALAEGETVVTGASELRVKESDRLAAMTTGLAALGVAVEPLPDGLRIHGGRVRGGTVDSRGDHRVAMAFAILGSPGRIAGHRSRRAECRDVVPRALPPTARATGTAAVGGGMSQVPVIAIDGPSGSGKGTIARRVARHFGWHLLDSGALYRLVALAGMRAGLRGRRCRGPCPSGGGLDVAFGMDEAGGERVRACGRRRHA